MEAITWVCFFGFVTLLSFLIYNLLSKPLSEDDKYEEERSHRKKNANRSEHIRIAAEKAEKAKEKKLKKQNKKQKKAVEFANVNTDGESENKVSEDETAVEPSVEPAADVTTVNKKSKMPKLEEATKKVAKEEVKDKKEVTLSENPEPKDDKAKKVKQAAEKQVVQVKKQKVIEKPIEVKPVEKPVEVVQEKPVEVVIQPVQQQVAKKETVKPLQANPKNKKKKNDANILQLKGESEAVNINLLIAMLKKAELSRSENQLLIDALLNKQQDDVSEWMQGPQDPTVKLKKQLIEVEEALKNEKEAASGMQVKLKELRAELNNERSSHKHMDEKLAAAQNEAHAYSLKFQHAVEEKQAIASQHSNCIQQIKQFQKQLSDEKLGFLKLKEEHAAAEEQYHEAIRAVQNDYAVTSQQFQAEATALRSQLAMVQEQNMIVNDEYIKGKNELERVLGESQFQVTKLQTELNSANRALDEMKEELNHLTVLLNNSEMEKQSFAEKVERLSGQIVSLHAEMQSLRDQNESLSKKSSENWENGFSYNNKQDNAELEELKKTVKTLKGEVESKTNKVDELSMIVVSCKNETSKKDALLQKALTEVETLKATVSPVKIIEDENLSQLKEIIVERNEEITNLKNEIETHKQRNNELRNKNWKAVEALKQAEERSLQNNKHEGTKENNLEGKIENWVKGLIQKVDSSIVLEDKGNQDLSAWLSKVDKALNFAKLESSSTQSSPSQYEGQINHLQHLVDNYKKIIVDTEGMLNELQNNVETREAEYKERIKELELLVEHQGRNPTQCASSGNFTVSIISQAKN